MGKGTAIYNTNSLTLITITQAFCFFLVSPRLRRMPSSKHKLGDNRLVRMKRLAFCLLLWRPQCPLRVQDTLRLTAERDCLRWMIVRSLARPHLGPSPMDHHSISSRVLSVGWSFRKAVKLTRNVFLLFCFTLVWFFSVLSFWDHLLVYFCCETWLSFFWICILC